jgi:pimeloyl-ACP methyl ester carboxylesterase
MPKIKVNNIHLFYETYGQDDPIVFVTGFNADRLVWSGIVEEYAKSHQVIILDNRGSGYSDSPDMPYTIEMMADDVIGLCDSLGLKTCHFIGLSMGSAIVQTLGYKYPERCKSTVLTNGFMQIDIKFALFAQGRLELFKTQASAETIARISLGWAFSSQYLNQVGMTDYLLSGASANPHPMTEVGYRNQLHALLKFNSETWIHKIAVPTLVISSDQDMIVAESHMHEMAMRIPNAEYYCFKNVGHVPQIEQPELFNKVVQRFIALH